MRDADRRRLLATLTGLVLSAATTVVLVLWAAPALAAHAVSYNYDEELSLRDSVTPQHAAILDDNNPIPRADRAHGPRATTIARRASGQPRAPVEIAGQLFAPQTASASRWSRTSFGGNRVYQRSDLIDPNLVDRAGMTNLQRMQQGLAPIGPDGRSINLHHMLQTQSGPVAEVTQTMHQQSSRILHVNPSSVPSGIDRGAFDVWRSDYWMWRAKDF